MKINKMITKHNFNSGSTGRIKYIVIHYVGALGGAEANCKYYRDIKRDSSAHYFVGFDGEIWQCVEDKNIAWHCGSKNYKHQECRNANSLAIEMCVKKKNKNSLKADDKDWYFKDKTITATVELTQVLAQKYNIPISNIIRHYDVTGKICPNPYVFNTNGQSWEEFKKAVSKGLDKKSVSTTKQAITDKTSESNLNLPQ